MRGKQSDSRHGCGASVEFGGRRKVRFGAMVAKVSIQRVAAGLLLFGKSGAEFRLDGHSQRGFRAPMGS